MNLHRISILIFFCVSLNGCSGAYRDAGSIDVDIDAMIERGEDVAPALLSAITQLQRMNPKDPTRVRFLTQYGEYQMRSRQFVAAERSFREALTAATVIGNVSPFESARAMDGLACALAASNKDGEALSCAAKAVQLYENASGEMCRRRGRAFGLLGDLHYRGHNYLDAERSYKEAVKILCECDGSIPDPEAASAMRALGQCLLSQNRDAEARPWLRRSFEILRDEKGTKRRFQVLGPGGTVFGARQVRL